jgi:hypothetical protein
MKTKHSMPRNGEGKDDEKKGSSSRQLKQKGKAPKRGGSHHDDDDDVDSRGNIRGLIDYSSDEEYEFEEEESSEEDRRSPRRSSGKGFRPLKRKPSAPLSPAERVKKDPRRSAVEAKNTIRKKLRKESSKKKLTPSTSDSSFDYEDEDDEMDIEEEDEEEEEEEDDEEEDEEDDEEEDDDDDVKGMGGLHITFGGGGGSEMADRMIPIRHNMKKESSDVKQFVKLVTKPLEENTIDDQIDQFKALNEEKKKSLLESLEKRDEYSKKEQPLMFRLLSMKLTPETMANVMARYNALQNMDPSSGEYYKLRVWMEKLVSLPLGMYKEMPVKIESGQEECGRFMMRARACLEDAIYGQDEAKLQILQFIASRISNPNASGLSLLLVGPPGIGKTSLIKNGIAKALDWPFQFISLGGDSDATTYTGHQFVYEGSHCGKIANSLATSKSMSMVMLFDELDKISATSKGEEVQNLLVHLTDPVQNSMFEDKYLTGVPLDLSKIMFVFSGNDINKIDKILMDRMVVVKLNGYGVKEKLTIAEQYLMPAALREVNLVERVGIPQDVLKYMLDNYAGQEEGVRELKRCCEQIVQKVNMLRIYNSKELPFHIPNFNLPFMLKKEHIDLFLKKKEPTMEISVQRMYT